MLAAILNFIKRFYVTILIIAFALLVALQGNKIYKFIDKYRWQLQNKVSKLEKKITFLEAKSTTPQEEKKSRTEAISLSSIQKKSKNAIVQIFSDTLKFNWIEPYVVPSQSESAGSGFFIDEQGHFLTNYHVVGHSLRNQIQVACLGQERLECKVVGVCPERDLALLKLTNSSLEKITKVLGKIEYLQLGDSDKIQRGSEVLTMGHPLARKGIKSTSGIVSGWEEINVGDRGFGLSCLEIDAAINPGSSGGPSLNLDGQVIGINFSGIIADGAQNIGYVLPINELKSAIRDLYDTKLLRKPRLGALFHHSTPDFAEQMGNPEEGGYFVGEVLKKSLAEKIGLKKGDMVYEVNGFLIDNHGDTVAPWREDKVSFLNILHRLEVGDKVNMIAYRNGKRIEFNFELEAEKEASAIRIMYPGYEQIDYEVFGGMVVMELSTNHLAIFCAKNPYLIRYGLTSDQNEKKLIITHVQPTSQSDNSRNLIMPGSILNKINSREVNSIDQLREEIRSSLKKDFITVETNDLYYCPLSMKKIMQDEGKLAKMYKYTSDHSVVLREIEKNNRKK